MKVVDLILEDIKQNEIIDFGLAQITSLFKLFTVKVTSQTHEKPEETTLITGN